MLDDNLEKIITNSEKIRNWIEMKRKINPIPIYGSVDIRDSGYKVGVVDSNHFPAGFNNIDSSETPQLSALMRENIERTKEGVKHVHIYPESHTRNPAYVENLKSLKNILQHAGYKVTVGSSNLSEFGSLDALTEPLTLDHVILDDEKVRVRDYGIPDLVLLNNDLTDGIPLELVNHSVVPDISMGWHTRRKSTHFRKMDEFIDELCELIEIDSWLLKPIWMVSEDKCLEKEECLNKLVLDIDKLLDEIKKKYEEYGVEEKPCVYVKNDRGTYGLGIIIIESGSQLLGLSKRKLHKLTYGKGGALAENFLIQEGIPTSLSYNASPAEPVAYLVDGRPVSWFYRVNKKKTNIGNLNSPSADFISKNDFVEKNSDLRIEWHQLVAELSMLAMGSENYIS